MESLEVLSRLMQEAKLPPLTDEQLDIMRRFSRFEIGVADMRRSLNGIFDFVFDPKQRTGEDHVPRRSVTGRFRLPEPGIIITREHIANALELKRFDLITERDLVEWATILLMNDAYVLDPGDEDLIAEWLNDISLNLNAG